MILNETHVEEAALEWFGELGYTVGHGPQLSQGEPAAEYPNSGPHLCHSERHDASESAERRVELITTT